ncbi:MAG TPA: DUF6665 family protein [Gammaproteobacteria bacterium]|nr:DUF6665 family protein [Gammaproteobacteria bacterium]
MTSGWVDPFAYEISKEKAGTLGRVGRGLEKTLAALESCTDGAKREELIWDASELVTSLVVQREACGLRSPGFVFEFYRVPREVIVRMGMRRPV